VSEFSNLYKQGSSDSRVQKAVGYRELLFGVSSGSCDDTCCFGIQVKMDAAKLFKNVRITRFRQCSTDGQRK